MENLFEFFLNNPTILVCIIAFVIFFLVISIIKKFAKIGVTILIIFLILGIVGNSTVRSKYNISFKDNVLTATVNGKEINLDFEKLSDAKINIQKSDNTVNIKIDYHDGTSDELSVPNFLYYYLKLKAKAENMSFDIAGS